MLLRLSLSFYYYYWSKIKKVLNIYIPLDINVGLDARHTLSTILSRHNYYVILGVKKPIVSYVDALQRPTALPVWWGECSLREFSGLIFSRAFCLQPLRLKHAPRALQVGYKSADYNLILMDFSSSSVCFQTELSGFPQLVKAFRQVT